MYGGVLIVLTARVNEKIVENRYKQSKTIKGLKIVLIEVWIAYKGLIYDVSRSRLWHNGKHYEHWAGQDLTHELPDAPHDEWVFDHFDPIGKLI